MSKESVITDLKTELTYSDFDGLLGSLLDAKRLHVKNSKSVHNLVMGVENAIYAYRTNANSYANIDDINKTVRDIIDLLNK